MPRRLNLLLIEDDDIAVEALQRSLERCDGQFVLIRARDGTAGLAILRGGADQPPLRYPYLILLDWRLPRMTGGVFLQQLRADPRLRSSTVFVITNSADDCDKAAAYGWAVAGYFRKPKLGRDFDKLVEVLVNYQAIVQFLDISQ